MQVVPGVSKRVALIVGAAGGIGAACARAFAEAGGIVALADLDINQVRSVARGLGVAGTSAHAVDLSTAEEPVDLVASVVQEHGSLDIVVSAAGILRPASFLDLQASDWDRMHAVNVRGNVLLAQAAARWFVGRGVPGRIVVFASIVSRLARLDNVAYASSKAALVQAVRCAA